MLVFRGHAHPFHEILSEFLAMICAFTFAIALSFALAGLAFSFALVRLAFALVVLVVGFCTLLAVSCHVSIGSTPRTVGYLATSDLDPLWTGPSALIPNFHCYFGIFDFIHELAPLGFARSRGLNNK